ncbi:MAG: hypothetical protein AB8G05_25320 [Oligoflexales bacterium]
MDCLDLRRIGQVALFLTLIFHCGLVCANENFHNRVQKASVVIENFARQKENLPKTEMPGSEFKRYFTGEVFIHLVSKGSKNLFEKENAQSQEIPFTTLHSYHQLLSPTVHSHARLLVVPDHVRVRVEENRFWLINPTNLASAKIDLSDLRYSKLALGKESYDKLVNSEIAMSFTKNMDLNSVLMQHEFEFLFADRLNEKFLDFLARNSIVKTSEIFKALLALVSTFHTTHEIALESAENTFGDYFDELNIEHDKFDIYSTLREIKSKTENYKAMEFAYTQIGNIDANSTAFAFQEAEQFYSRNSAYDISYYLSNKILFYENTLNISFDENLCVGAIEFVKILSGVADRSIYWLLNERLDEFLSEVYLSLASKNIEITKSQLKAFIAKFEEQKDSMFKPLFTEHLKDWVNSISD